MKKTSHPPKKDSALKPLTENRKKILATAMAQLKKTRAQMDPSILKKIRSIIAGNPQIMKKLGVGKMPEEEGVAKPLEQVLSSRKSVAPTLPKKGKSREEKIDQGHNMEVLAKLMTLKPGEIENIKSVLMKSKD